MKVKTSTVCRIAPVPDLSETKVSPLVMCVAHGTGCTQEGCIRQAKEQLMSTQELLEAEAANIKPIEEEIEDERRKVEAKTPITEEVSCLSFLCMPWCWITRLVLSQ